MIGLNIRDRSSIVLSLRKCRFQLRISARIAFTALSETAGLKLMNQACRPLIALYLQIGFPDFPSGNTKRLCFIFPAPPLAGWPDRRRLTTHTPFAPWAFAHFSATTGCSAPWRRIRTLALVAHATCSFSVSIGAEGSHVSE